MGRLQRLPHGQHRPRTWRRSGRSPAPSRTSLPSPSQNKAEAAQKAVKFKDEIVPVTVKTRKGDVVVDTDEFPATAPPSRRWRSCGPPSPRNGTVTAGNASGINDGAAALVLMSADEARSAASDAARRIVSWATTGVDPAVMGIGPMTASQEGAEGRLDGRGSRPGRGQRGVRRAGLRGGKDLGWDTGKVNVNGGAIALGHPIGASGRARADDAALRDAEARRQEGPRDAVHRRRHGHRHVRSARLIGRSAAGEVSS